MENLVNYLFEATIILSALYLVYIVLMRQDTFFGAHRSYLLSTLVLASLLPLASLPGGAVGPEGVMAFIMDPITVYVDEQSAASGTGITLLGGLSLVYILGAIVFGTLFLLRISYILWHISKSEQTNIPSSKRGSPAPFSFFRYIYIPKGMYTESEREKIRVHEEAHIRQWHSLDIVLVECLLPLFWFNPFFWMLRKELKNTHEYLADRQVIKMGFNPVHYQQLLFMESTGFRLNSISNHFNQSLIKKRIVMMTQPKVSRSQIYKYLFVTPLSLIMAVFLALSIQQGALAQAGPEIPPPPPKPTSKDGAMGSATTTSALPAGQEEIKVFKVVEKMPSFKGGTEALGKYFRENIKYPESAKKDGISGTVFITFLVEKTGKITDVKILRGVNEALDAEALRVAKLMPDWNPGLQDEKPVNTVMNLPVKFALDEKEKKEEK